MEIDTTPKRGDEIRLAIDEAAFEGRSVGRVNGFVVFVDGAVPGDVVKARIVKRKSNYAEAKVVSVEQASPFRVEPRCKHFGVCGGCRWQHVDYSKQLQFKEQHVVDAFERIGGLSNLNLLSILGADDIYFYRNKMEYSFADRQWVDRSTRSGAELPANLEAQKVNVFLGLHVPQRYDKVLEITECHLQSEVSNRILSYVRSFTRRRNLLPYSSRSDSGYLRFLVIRQSERTRELMVNLVTVDDRPEVMRDFTADLRSAVPETTTVVNTINSRKAQIAFGELEKVYYGDGVIHERLGEHVFTISARSFFQTNTAQAEKLFEAAKSFAELKGDEVVWDLYSGTGSIALFVSDAAREVVGIEAVESAVRDAERNAQANNVRNCMFLLGDLKERLTADTTWMQSSPKPDVMIIDPPRSGMHPKAVDEILNLAPPRIVYVSCNPMTQARDVKVLCSEKYVLTKLQPVDLFPHTYHIENVAQLLLK
ncbi:MAG: 23S rRNA (uracil(1939)-C(5))-methyltransferase RlmD [Ignavibacteria bacterium]|nr:23S rRNA (uracil(1939)-C(5))-methyltransferase RlmD [Ignavibacteria bacterium]